MTLHNKPKLQYLHNDYHKPTSTLNIQCNISVLLFTIIISVWIKLTQIIYTSVSTHVKISI